MNRIAVLPHRGASVFSVSFHGRVKKGAEDAVGFPQTGSLAVAQEAINNGRGSPEKSH